MQHSGELTPPSPRGSRNDRDPLQFHITRMEGAFQCSWRLGSMNVELPRTPRNPRNPPACVALTQSKLCRAASIISASILPRFDNGKSFSGVTSNAWAKSKTSASLTSRTRASIFASVPRVSAQPMRWHFAARASCEKPLSTRSLRTCGPMMFCLGIAPKMELDE